MEERGDKTRSIENCWLALREVQDRDKLALRWALSQSPVSAFSKLSGRHHGSVAACVWVARQHE